MLLRRIDCNSTSQSSMRLNSTGQGLPALTLILVQIVISEAPLIINHACGHQATKVCSASSTLTFRGRSGVARYVPLNIDW